MEPPYDSNHENIFSFQWTFHNGTPLVLLFQTEGSLALTRGMDGYASSPDRATHWVVISVDFRAFHSNHD
jgi:hypothetical protein